MKTVSKEVPRLVVISPINSESNPEVCKHADQTENEPVVCSNFPPAKSGGARKYGLCYDTMPVELAVFLNQEESEESKERIGEAVHGIPTRFRKSSARKISFSVNASFHSTIGDPDTTLHPIETPVATLEQQNEKIYNRLGNPPVKNATGMPRNESATSFKSIRRLSLFQKAIETLANVQAELASIRDGGSVFEMFISKKSPQILATLAATIGAFATGTVLAWSSPALDQLVDSSDMRHATSTQISWVASIVPLAATLAGPPTGKTIKLIGRKFTMLALSIPFTIGWLLIAFAVNIEMILVGRFLTGYCTGAFSLTVPIFINETAEDSIRGALGSGFQLMMNLGILFSYILGAFVNWRHLSLISASIPVVMCLIMLYVPASPIYLLSRGRLSDAEKALMWFRGATRAEQIREELELIQESIDQSSADSPTFSEYLKPEILKPLNITIGLMILQACSGSDAITFYSVSIFHEAGSFLDIHYATIIIGGVQVLATLISLVLVDKAGRRVLLLLSDFFTTLSLAALGFFFFLGTDLRKTFALLPLVSLIVFVIAYSLGLGPIPWMMMGEVLPHRVIGPASAIATSFNWFCTFIVIRFFADLKEAIGPHWSYISFSIFCALGLFFVFFFVPETKGKSLDQIQQIFLKSKPEKVGDPRRKISRTTLDSYFFA